MWASASATPQNATPYGLRWGFAPADAHIRSGRTEKQKAKTPFRKPKLQNLTHTTASGSLKQQKTHGVLCLGLLHTQEVIGSRPVGPITTYREIETSKNRRGNALGNRRRVVELRRVTIGL